MKNPLKHWERQRKRLQVMQDRLTSMENLLVTSPMNSSSRIDLPQIYERLGLSLILDPSSLVDKTVITWGAWENAQLEFLFLTASSKMDIKKAVFLDVGAYWGLYSLKAVQAGFERIVAFESDPYNFSQLQAQLFLNKLVGKIEANNFAISDSNKLVTLFESLNQAEGNRGGVGVTEDSSKGGRKAEARSLDSVLDLSNVDLVMKIDVEGHEASVFEGMMNLVSKNNILIQVEIFEEHEATVFPICESLGLKRINQIAVDHYFVKLI